MKEVFTIAIIMYSCYLSGQESFLSINNKWLFESNDYTNYPSIHQEIDSIEVVSDTLINNVKYYKLLASAIDPCGVFRSTEFLREDEGKIFRLNSDFANEELMIDFNSENYFMNYEAQFGSYLVDTEVMVDSIGVERLPNDKEIEVQYLRIINNLTFSDDVTFFLSPQVGYVQGGLLFPFIGIGLCDIMKDIQLRCFVSGSDTINFKDLDCYESSIESSIIDFTEQKLNVHPNPVDNFLFIEFEQNFTGTIRIIDINGSVQLKIESNFSHECSLDVSQLKAGLYFLQLDSDTIKTTKFLKN